MASTGPLGQFLAAEYQTRDETSMTTTSFQGAVAPTHDALLPTLHGVVREWKSHAGAPGELAGEAHLLAPLNGGPAVAKPVGTAKGDGGPRPPLPRRVVTGSLRIHRPTRRNTATRARRCGSGHPDDPLVGHGGRFDGGGLLTPEKRDGERRRGEPTVCIPQSLSTGSRTPCQAIPLHGARVRAVLTGRRWRTPDRPRRKRPGRISFLAGARPRPWAPHPTGGSLRRWTGRNSRGPRAPRI